MLELRLETQTHVWNILMLIWLFIFQNFKPHFIKLNWKQKNVTFLFAKIDSPFFFSLPSHFYPSCLYILFHIRYFILLILINIIYFIIINSIFLFIYLLPWTSFLFESYTFHINNWLIFYDFNLKLISNF